MKRTATVVQPLCGAFDPYALRKPIFISAFHEGTVSGMVVPEGPKGCNHCGKESTTPQRCGNCQAVFYCDKTCQKKNWKTHKLTCSNRVQGSDVKAWSRHGGKFKRPVAFERSILIDFS